MRYFFIGTALILHLNSTSFLCANVIPCDILPVECATDHFTTTHRSHTNKLTCLGTELPYNHFSIIPSNNSEVNFQPKENLQLWEGLRHVPRCWQVIQPLLCAVYMPKCVYENDSQVMNSSYVELPSKDLCERTREPCKIVAETRGWPVELQCGYSHFKTSCSNAVEKLKFNHSRCGVPLVPTRHKEGWFPGIDSCGIPCQNPLYTEEEHSQVHTLVQISGSLCLICTIFTVLTFIIDWHNANHYPALILFFINICYTIACVGWMVQFSSGAREDIVCRRDGIIRAAEPKLGAGESASCTVVFIVIYYFTMAALVWFVILSYCWHLMFKAIGMPRDAIQGKKGHFHLAAWTLPLVLTIVCLAIQQIDGDSLSGICFVGYRNQTFRGLFVLLPVGLVVAASFYFIARGFITLTGLKSDTPDVVSDKANSKIKNTSRRLGIFAVVMLILVLATFTVHIYIFVNDKTWKQSLHDYIICKLGIYPADNTEECQVKSRATLMALQANILMFFGTGIALSSWSWNAASLDAWKRFYMRVCNVPQNKPIRLKKHEIIARAFKNRRRWSGSSQSHMSVEFRSTHDDPLGMRMELNSVSSMEVSSTWAAALPRMTARRGALVDPSTGTRQRRYSSSDIESAMSSLKQSHSQAMHEERMKRRTKKKHKKRSKKRGGRGRVSPMTAAMAFAAASGGIPNVSSFQKSRNGRRASDTSVWSNSSTRSFKISMEKIEITASNRNSDTSDNEKKCFHPVRTVRSFSSNCTDRPDTAAPPAAKMANFNTSKCSFSMFTASALLPSSISMISNAIEMLDLDTPCSCTDCDDACEEYALYKKTQAQFHYPSDGAVDIEAEVSDISTTSV